MEYADVVIQSYHPVKHITTGEGGAVLTNDQKIDEKVRRLRTHGISKELNHLEKNDGPWYYEMHDIGYNYRLPNLNAALGCAQMERLPEFLEIKVQLAERYRKFFDDLEHVFTRCRVKHVFVCL